MIRKRTARQCLLTTRISGQTLAELEEIARALDIAVSFVAHRCIRHSLRASSVQSFIKGKTKYPKTKILPQGPRFARAQAKRLKDEGLPLKQIADRLNKQNFLTYQGRMWQEDSVCRLLKQGSRTRETRRRRRRKSR